MFKHTNEDQNMSYHEDDDARCRHCGSDGDHEEWCRCYEGMKTDSMTPSVKPAGELTVERANQIQAEWMALDSSGPKKEIDRVCRLMSELPGSYFAVVADTGEATAMIGGQPCHAGRLPLKECMGYYPHIQTRLIWFCHGAWGTLADVQLQPVTA